MNKLDEAINGIANEIVDEERIEQSAGRVRHKLFAHTHTVNDRIRGCADYQALIPAYLSRSLSAGRSLLLQDHTRECPVCRHALQQARTGSAPTLIRPVTPPSHSIPNAWAIAAMVLVALGVGALVLSPYLSPGSGKITVQKVHGILYTVADSGLNPVFAGHEIAEGQKLRTSKESTAVVQLGDGSLVELNERSEISVTRAMRGATIRLNRGDIIVQAAKQHYGTLDVLTPECTVSVKGTIFAVDRGTKGSRVSVVEGSVQVAQGSGKQMLKPGDQLTTNPAVEKIPVAKAVSWSSDSVRYLSLLGEFNIIKKGLEAMPSPALRHNATLLPLVPRDAVLYAAIPNPGRTLAEAERLLNQRLQQSEVLSAWWEEQKAGPKLDQMLTKLRTLSDYLGDEVVITVSGDWDGNYTAPMVLAQVKKPGLESFLASETKMPVHVMDLRASAKLAEVKQAASAEPGMYFGIQDDMVAIAWSPNQIAKLSVRLAEPPAPLGQNGLLGQVKQAYDRGAGWLLCVNMEQIARNIVKDNGDAKGPHLPPGFEAMHYLIVERKDVGGQIENQATLSFEGRRWGIAGWLAAPAPMGSLDFVSPTATFAVSMVLTSPQSMLNDLLATMSDQHPEFQAKLDDFYKNTGIRVNSDLAGALGGEVTFALDGPMLPLPSWKLIVEVYNPDRLQWSMQQMVDAFNRAPGACTDCTLSLTNEQVGSRTFYTLKSAKLTYEIDYTFVDGYLIAAPNRELLNTAIQNRSTGYLLSHSDTFRSLLPHDGRLNFSAIAYHNLGTTLKPLADTLGAMATSASQREALQAVADNTRPGLVYAYGQDDSIVIAGSNGLFGLDLNTLALPALLQTTHRTKATQTQ